MERQQSLRAARAEAEWPMSARWSPDGVYLAIGTNTPAVYVAKPSNGSQSATLSPLPRGLCIWSNGAPQAIGLLPRDLAQVARSRSGRTLVLPWIRRSSESTRSSARWLHLLVSGSASPRGIPRRVDGARKQRVNCSVWDASSGTRLKSFVPHPGSAVLECHWKGDYLITDWCAAPGRSTRCDAAKSPDAASASPPYREPERTFRTAGRQIENRFRNPARFSAPGLRRPSRS